MEEKRLAVEDPVSCKRNLFRSIQAGSVYDYIADCLKTSYLYFGTIQTSLGPIVSKIMINERLVIQSIPGDIELMFLLLVMRKLKRMSVCLTGPWSPGWPRLWCPGICLTLALIRLVSPALALVHHSHHHV